MSDDLVKRLRSENTMFGYYDSPAIQIEAADRIAELEAALATARRDGMEEAAQWHDQQAARAQKFADMKVSAQDAKVWSDYAQNHSEYAAAIRAALEGGKKDG